MYTYMIFLFFPKQFTVGVLNAFLVCPRWLGRCIRLPGLVFLLSPACLPSGLGCCVRLAGLVFLLSPTLSPSLFPSGLGCCVRLAGLVFLLSPVLSPGLSHLVWDAVSAFWLVSPLQLVSDVVFSTWSEMLCPPSWACLPACLRLCVWACLPVVFSTWSGMLCPPPLACLPAPACLRSCLPSCHWQSGTKIHTFWSLRWCNLFWKSQDIWNQCYQNKELRLWFEDVAILYFVGTWNPKGAKPK